MLPSTQVCETNPSCFSPHLSLASPFHLDKHTFHISLFADGDCLPHGCRSHTPPSVSLAKDRMFTCGDLEGPTGSLSPESSINLPRTAETKGCLVCTYLLGLPLSLSTWERKPVGKKVHRPYMPSLFHMAPVASYPLEGEGGKEA